MKITVREGQPSLVVRDMEGMTKAIADAGLEARTRDKVGVIFLESDNGNEISMAVGAAETVLGFVYSHRDAPYLMSKGSAQTELPVFTCYSALEHHTEYPRTAVIPFKDGLAAVQEFFGSGDLPKCIQWETV
jgi:Immunity protein Imm1